MLRMISYNPWDKKGSRTFSGKYGYATVVVKKLCKFECNRDELSLLNIRHKNIIRYLRAESDRDFM